MGGIDHSIDYIRPPLRYVETIDIFHDPKFQII